MESIRVLFLIVLGIELFGLSFAIEAKREWKVWVILILLNIMSMAAFVIVMPAAQGYEFSTLGEAIYTIIAIILLLACARRFKVSVHQ